MFRYDDLVPLTNRLQELSGKCVVLDQGKGGIVPTYAACLMDETRHELMPLMAYKAGREAWSLLKAMIEGAELVKR